MADDYVIRNGEMSEEDYVNWDKALKKKRSEEHDKVKRSSNMVWDVAVRNNAKMLIIRKREVEDKGRPMIPVSC